MKSLWYWFILNIWCVWIKRHRYYETGSRDKWASPIQLQVHPDRAFTVTCLICRAAVTVPMSGHSQYSKLDPSNNYGH